MKHFIFTWIFILALLSFLSACSSSTEETNMNKKKTTNTDKMTVYTTIYPVQDFAEKIGGEHVIVENIIPPGADAHSFEPTTKLIIELAGSDAFIYSGTGIEGFVDAVVDAVQDEPVQTVNAAEGIEFIGAIETEIHDEHEDEKEEESDSEEHDKEVDQDPHVWLDPSRSIILAENIKNAFVDLKPEAKEDFEENFEELKEDLESLDQQFKKLVKNAPKKTFIVSHSAYGYWEDAYGLIQIGISGLSPTNEPSQKQLKEIIIQAQENDISYILFEQNLNNKIANIIKTEVGADTLTLHNLEALTENDTKNEEDYFTIMKRNIEVLQQALK
jgi:zinc transport system substrate-binding protein